MLLKNSLGSLAFVGLLIGGAAGCMVEAHNGSRWHGIMMPLYPAFLAVQSDRGPATHATEASAPLLERRPRD